MVRWNYEATRRILFSDSWLGEADARGGDPTLLVAMLRLYRQLRIAVYSAEGMDVVESSHRALERAAQSIAAEGERFTLADDQVRAAILGQMTLTLQSAATVIREFDEMGPTLDEVRDTLDAIDRGLEDVRLVLAVGERVDRAVESAAGLAEASQEAMVGARSALDAAQSAAAESATTALESDFDRVAADEAKAAGVWRAATLVVLALTLTGSIFFVLEATSTVVTLQAAVFRLAVLSALAASAAYLARQASHHRRIATWARSIQVQLRSFRGFVEKIDDRAVQDGMYELFTRRVLAPPPESGKTSADTTNLIQPILEQVIKRS